SGDGSKNWIHRSDHRLDRDIDVPMRPIQQHMVLGTAASSRIQIQSVAWTGVSRFEEKKHSRGAQGGNDRDGGRVAEGVVSWRGSFRGYEVPGPAHERPDSKKVSEA